MTVFKVLQATKFIFTNISKYEAVNCDPQNVQMRYNSRNFTNSLKGTKSLLLF